MKRVTEEWLKAAQDDLAVIEKILDSEFLTHMVAVKKALESQIHLD